MRGIYLNRKLIKVCFNNFILLHIVLVISHLHCFIVGYKLECNARGQSIYWTICKKIPFISPSLCLCRCSYDRPSRVCGIWRATVVYIIYAIMIAYCKILKAKTQLMLFCIIYSDLFNKIQFSILFYSICLSHGIVVSREKSYCWVGGVSPGLFELQLNIPIGLYLFEMLGNSKSYMNGDNLYSQMYVR